MPELRQNPATKEWVIIATERAKRPHDFSKLSKDTRSAEPHVASCPFCPGNENLTPPEDFAIRDRPDAPWRVRVVANKFAALVPEGSLQREEQGFFRAMDAVGRHEVVVETPVHNRPLALMEPEEIELVIRAWRQRYFDLRQDPRLRLILIFKNHGGAAGTSLEHPHSQICATPIVPYRIRMRYREATQYWDDTGRCVYSDMCQQELKDGRRMVLEAPRFCAFHPFASRSPFETWIMPRRHSACFASITDDEIEDLALVLKNVLSKLYKVLNNPDHNMIIHTAPVTDEEEEYYLWHIQIVLRLTNPAGFEMGSGIYINTALPEETAAFMREA
jgi:UDPglucose--hexose-1-phosphate uridylyltransferase